MGQPVVHFEIGCRDRAKTGQFFGELFGWNIDDRGPASMIAAEQGGITGHITALGHDPFHYTIFYVQVDDVQAYRQRLSARGIAIEETDAILNRPRFFVHDPFNNLIEITQITGDYQ